MSQRPRDKRGAQCFAREELLGQKWDGGAGGGFCSQRSGVNKFAMQWISHVRCGPVRAGAMVGSWSITRSVSAWVWLVLFWKCRKLVLDNGRTRLRAASAVWWNMTIIGCSFR